MQKKGDYRVNAEDTLAFFFFLHSCILSFVIRTCPAVFIFRRGVCYEGSGGNVVHDTKNRTDAVSWIIVCFFTLVSRNMCCELRFH